MKILNIKQIFWAFFAVFLTMALVSCVGNPVRNVQSEMVPTNIKSKADVKKAIVLAAQSLGWRVKEIDNNTLRAAITVRGKHRAEVKITYSQKEYSITYKSSDNLNYDAQSNTIHRNYNSWVDNLNNSIQSQFFIM